VDPLVLDLGRYERGLREQGFRLIAGVDEAGRGALAGPLVAAAVILPAEFDLEGINDSKVLTALQRDAAFERIVRHAVARSVCRCTPTRIDRRGLHKTNVWLLRRCITTLPVAPDYVLTDGFPVPGLARPTLAVWKGDRVAACVAAASVLAKVTRDRMMLDLHERWPEYDFAGHKGYITDVHSAALERHGPCPEHRMRFVNVRTARDAYARRGLQVTGVVAMVDDEAMSPVPGEL